MSRNSASNLIALSDRISMAFMREITKVTRNYTSTLGWTVKQQRKKTHLYVGIRPDEQFAPQKD